MSLSLSIHSTDLEALEADVLVLGVLKGSDGAYLAPSSLSEDSVEGINELLEALGASGAPDQLLRLPGLEDTGAGIVALAGLGSDTAEGQERLDALRYAAGSAARQLVGSAEEIAFDFGVSSVEEIEAIAHGAVLGNFVEEGLRGKTQDSIKEEIDSILIVSSIDQEEAEETLVHALVLGETAKDARRLVNLPPSHLYPETFAEFAAEVAEDYANIEIELFHHDRLAEEGFGGISGVGQGSPRKPVLAVVKYTPENPKAHVALVGKGITFDTGGNSLKPAASMMTMKCDMAGAASVLNAVVASAELDVPVAVTGYLCLAENMPGGHALRPEDIITMRDGRTVEVLNTDAEGRLVMADGIALASESNPDVILDIATLTGAAMAALGLRTAALLGDEEIRDRVIAAGAAAGESYWPMPLESYLRKSLESPVADIKNIGSRYGGALTAGLFLKEFVGEGIPWAHLDIAGPAFNEESPYGFTPKEGTGFGTATLVNFIESYAK